MEDSEKDTESLKQMGKRKTTWRSVQLWMVNDELFSFYPFPLSGLFRCRKGTDEPNVPALEKYKEVTNFYNSISSSKKGRGVIKGRVRERRNKMGGKS